MAQDTSQERFDIDCLRQIATDAEAQRVSLAAAMIKLHALAIARNAPAQREEALEIVRYSRMLYDRLPDKVSLAGVIERHPASTRLAPAAMRDLIDTVWDHLRRGRC